MALLIKEILPSLLPSERQWQIQLLQKWEIILGNLKTRVVLEKIQHDTLVLGVYDASWMQELYLLSPLILETINKNLDQSPIKQLRFKQAHRKKVVHKKNIVKHKKEYTTEPIMNSKQHDALKQIMDPELKSALYNFLIRCCKENV